LKIDMNALSRLKNFDTYHMHLFPNAEASSGAGASPAFPTPVADKKMKRLSIALIFFALLSSNLIAQRSENIITTEVPTDYKSDGCSLFPDCNYSDCCVEHDKDYYSGGSGKERWRSDKRLYKCVKSSKGWHNEIIAPVMWLGVRVFGVSFLPTPFRWGFGRTKAKKLKKTS